ncbi:hypothetical protein [Clostridium sp.]|uniref:hypothetical protein n=1 Tax=Clostridium sp. TaxID=1506 RepID=UPI002852B76D|nr:hypothetical protein [Clostridium sp.]
MRISTPKGYVDIIYIILRLDMLLYSSSMVIMYLNVKNKAVVELLLVTTKKLLINSNSL